MEIGVKTKLIALCGIPLGQSFAARIQNDAFRAAGLDYYYFPVEVDHEGLLSVLDAARYMNFAGLVITKPNKIFVCSHLDELDPLAKTMGSVNTVVKKGNKLIGYNTDGMACVQSLAEDAGIKVKEGSFFCLGAGGVGRAVACTLAHNGAGKIFITDQKEEAAIDLVAVINETYGEIAKHIPYNTKEAIVTHGREADVILNLSGLGMGEYIGKTPVSREVFRKGQLAFEAIYNPAETRFMSDAKASGCQVLNGLHMTVNQGAIGYRLHTGQEPPYHQMRRTISAILAGREE